MTQKYKINGAYKGKDIITETEAEFNSYLAKQNQYIDTRKALIELLKAKRLVKSKAQIFHEKQKEFYNIKKEEIFE